MGVTAAVAVGLSLALDALFEEFPGRVHPVALFGRLVGWFDRSWSAPRLVGVVVALALPLGAAAFVGGLLELAVLTDPWFAAVLAGLALFATTSLRMLLSAAWEVVGESEGDPEAARVAALVLVGRDTETLSAAELRSAAVESAAENLADGLVAPLAYFAVGAQLSLAVGVAAAVWVKAVNTLDSMLGYRSKPVGGPSARLDDLAMWLPARLSAVLLALAGGAPGALSRARTWAREPASPNSGWPMATLAVVLETRLVKRGHYDLNPEAPLPSVERAQRGVRVVAIAGGLAFVLAGAVAFLGPLADPPAEVVPWY